MQEVEEHVAILKQASAQGDLKAINQTVHMHPHTERASVASRMCVCVCVRARAYMCLVRASDGCAGAEPHLNTCFKHFMFFILEFSLVERKELEPLAEICKVILV